MVDHIPYNVEFIDAEQKTNDGLIYIVTAQGVLNNRKIKFSVEIVKFGREFKSGKLIELPE